MKRLLIVVMLYLGIIITAQAQCIPDINITQEGFSPASEDIACIVPNRLTDITLQYLSFDSVNYMGTMFRLDNIAFTAINNLPCGINWTTSNQSEQPPQPSWPRAVLRHQMSPESPASSVDLMET